MPIKLQKEKEEKIIESIKHYFAKERETEIGDLGASLLLDYILREIGPVVYNQAITDAQAVMAEKVNDLEGTCYHPEFVYWKK